MNGGRKMKEDEVIKLERYCVIYAIFSSLFSVGRREPIEEFSSQICILQILTAM